MKKQKQNEFFKITKGERAITLIALVVSIVVILLLAGVTIATLTGDNGILSQAQNAQEKNQIAKFKDDVSMAYMEIYAERAQVGNFTPIKANDIVPRLIEGYGYTSENLHRQIIGTVVLDAQEHGNIELATNDRVVVGVTPNDNNTKNYVRLGEKWYEFSITGDQVTVGEGMSELPDASENGGSSSLNASSNNQNVTAVADNGTKTVTIESNGTPTPQGTPAVVTVSYGGSEIKINVTVKQAYTLTLGSNNSAYGTVSVSPNAITSTEGANGTEYKYLAGTDVTITATPNEGYIFKGWYTGSDTTDDTKLISNAGSSYTITLNADTVLTAKFGDLDNSNSYAEGFVDYLGTRATIYLYANVPKTTSGTTITVTMPDNTSKSITALNDNTTISSTNNYATYTVAKDGIYSFQVKNNANNQTSTTVIKVEGIEKFTPIENAKVNGQSLSYYNSENKAYNYNGAAVPKGYYVDTNSTVENGLVITDDIDSEGYSTGNEWVWVPVNTKIKNNDIYFEESGNVYGATSIGYSKYGKLYSFSQVRKRDDYGSNTFYPKGRTDTSNLGTPAGYSGYREPSLLTDSTYGERANITSIAKRDGTGNFTSGQIAQVAEQYITDYNNMVTSIGRYKGFYIGRYELTNINGIAKEQPGTPADETWYSLYNKCLNLNKLGTQTETSMIYGSLWDATMQWLSSKYNVGYSYSRFSGYGNYEYEEINVSNSSTTVGIKSGNAVDKQLLTGQTSYTNSNSIYDLSGNKAEFTQEAKDTKYRVLRGRTSWQL